MQLHVSLTSPYARKARIAVRELGLDRVVTEVLVDPWTDPSLRALNPLSKVPTLVRDDGGILFESLLIVEYLDACAERPRLVPAAGETRWTVLSLHALADGIMDAAVGIAVERRRGQDAGRATILRHEAAITASLARAETGPLPATNGFADVGAIALASALGYLDLRMPELGWREDRPHLAGWFGAIERTPSFETTRPPAPGGTLPPAPGGTPPRG